MNPVPSPLYLPIVVDTLGEYINLDKNLSDEVKELKVKQRQGVTQLVRSKYLKLYTIPIGVGIMGKQGPKKN